MFSSNVRGKFQLEGGEVVTEKLFGLKLVPDNTTLQDQTVVMGFDCGAPPEPSVSALALCCDLAVFLLAACPG